MKPRENAGLVSGTGEAPAHNDMVFSVEAGSRKILREVTFISGGQCAPAQDKKKVLLPVT